MSARRYHEEPGLGGCVLRHGRYVARVAFWDVDRGCWRPMMDATQAEAAAVQSFRGGRFNRTELIEHLEAKVPR